MSNLSARIAVYTSPEKKAEVEAAITESGRTQQEWLRDALEHALAPDAATGDDRETELRLQGALAEIRRLHRRRKPRSKLPLPKVAAHNRNGCVMHLNTPWHRTLPLETTEKPN